MYPYSIRNSWKTYIKYKTEQKDAIDREIRILNNMNYCKNPYNKIYKTMFYYFNTMKKKKDPENKNLTTKIESTKERVKKRIITKVNELLPVGTGVVQEVYFSEFIVK